MGRRKRKKHAAAILTFIAAAAAGTAFCLSHCILDMPAVIETVERFNTDAEHYDYSSDESDCQINNYSDASADEAEKHSAARENNEQRKCYIKNVPHLYQLDDFPTGCESVAAVSLMQFYGINISAAEFIGSCLPTADYPRTADDGIMYGESPWEYFIGDPESSSGYGCYSTVILRAVQKALPEGYFVRAEDAASIDELTKKYTSKGNPVLVWATIGMKKAYPGKSWILPDGNEFTFICPEHALLLIGADDNCFYFSDSMSEDKVTSYPRADCEDAFASMGSQAIVIIPPNNDNP